MLDTFPCMFPATSINLLLVAVIVNLTKVRYLKQIATFGVKKMWPSMESGLIFGSECM